MPRRDDLDFDAWITVHRRHAISCDVHCEEAQFRLGPNGGSLVLCFTWTALTKFLRVAHEAVKLSDQKLSSRTDVYEVYADERSHQIHNRNNSTGREKQIILRVEPTKKAGRPADST
jgi:hypothetical protein